MQIHWTDLHCLSAAEREAVEQRLQRLARGHDDLQTVRLAVETSLHHTHGNKQARIASFVRGTPIAIHRERPELDIAIEEALADFESEVRRIRQRAATAP
jgi:ribosome-associated translation inhibitor RaiA